jgi:Protein of unknown function (DUF1638)
MPRVAAIVSCVMIVDEALHALELAYPAGNRPPMVWIESSLHEHPTELKAALQGLIDQLDEGAKTGRSVAVHSIGPGESPVDDLVEVEPAGDLILCFGYWGGGLEGLASRERGLACLRVHDCIEALLCRDCETGAVDRDTHSYYLTKGWLCHPGFIGSVDDWVRQHSGEDAKRMLKLMFAGYERISLIDTGAYDVAEWLPRSLSRAAEWELDHQIVPGTVDAYARLFAGHWGERDIIVTRPGEPIAFDDLLWGSEQDTDLWGAAR